MYHRPELICTCGDLMCIPLLTFVSSRQYCTKRFPALDYTSVYFDCINSCVVYNSLTVTRHFRVRRSLHRLSIVLSWTIVYKYKDIANQIVRLCSCYVALTYNMLLLLCHHTGRCCIQNSQPKNW